LAAELVRLPVRVILAFAPAAAAAKAATQTIPVVFVVGNDPVKTELITSFNRPGGNVTGVAFFANTLGAKRAGLLNELFPTATAMTMIANPNNPASAVEVDDARAAAQALGRSIHVLNAGSESEIEAAFAAYAKERAGALMIAADSFFNSRRELFVSLSRRHAVPVIAQWREFAEAGILMTYGASVADAARQAGVYVGRILKGEKPADLPVLQPTKFELVLNLKTAKALGLAIPPGVLSIADEVIE
jgi:ABC-type uncharacterized transport system substrate-binding protein